jgi:hypothetical protein
LPLSALAALVLTTLVLTTLHLKEDI